MFKMNKIQNYDIEKVEEFNNKKVIDIKDIDTSIFRTEYLRNKFSMMEYIDRLKEIFNSSNSIEKKITKYLGIENSIKKNLEPLSDKDKSYIYFSVGFFVTKILKSLKLKTTYKFYNYGVFENNDLIAVYFDLTLNRYEVDFTEYKDSLCKILSTTSENVIFNKIDDLYEILLFKKDLITMDYNSLFNMTDFETIEDEGYKFPIIIGKDESCMNVYLDFERNNSLIVLGDSQTGKSNILNVLLANLISLYSEEEVSILLLDSKDNEINKNFAISPHFIGYHTNILDYIPILKEIKHEMEMRKEILESAEMDYWNDLRIFLEEEEDLLKAFPWLFIIIDESQYTMSYLNSLGEEVLEEFIDLVTYISKNGRKYGVKFVMLGEASELFYKSSKLIEATDMKIVFEMEPDNFEQFIDINLIDMPSMKGEFILEDKDNIYPIRVKSCTLGLEEIEKLKYLIKILSLDMLKSVDMKNVYRSDKFVRSNNRKDYINEKELYLPENLFVIKRDKKVFEIANDLLKGRFNSSKYK